MWQRGELSFFAHKDEQRETCTGLSHYYGVWNSALVISELDGRCHAGLVHPCVLLNVVSHFRSILRI
jgi:hypothetical protein